MNETSAETTADVRFRNIVAAFTHAPAHARNRLLGRGEPDVMQFDLVAAFPRLPQQANVSDAAQGTLQGEGLVVADRFMHFVQQYAACLELACGRVQRRQAPRDFIGVQEAQTLDFGGQEVAGKGGLASSIAAANEINTRRHGGHGTSKRRGDQHWCGYLNGPSDATRSVPVSGSIVFAPFG